MGCGKQSEKDASQDSPGKLRVLDAGRAALRATDRLGHDSIAFPIPDHSLRGFQFLLGHPNAHVGVWAPSHEEENLLVSLVHKFCVQSRLAETFFQCLGRTRLVKGSDGYDSVHIIDAVPDPLV
jgi:hypothetical protein